jgi:hypothetical protein
MPSEALSGLLTYFIAYAINLSQKHFARFRIHCDYTFLARNLPCNQHDYRFGVVDLIRKKPIKNVKDPFTACSIYRTNRTHDKRTA